MGDGGSGLMSRASGGAEVDAPGFGKSVRSFAEALTSLEKEVEIIFDRARTESTGGMMKYFKKIFGGGPLGVDLSGMLRMRGSGLDSLMVGRALGKALGLADDRALDAVREDVRDIMEQVARLREREVALAGGVSQLRSRSARFDEALAGLARVQGKYVARLDTQSRRCDDIERLTEKRDDHITRLIRDTASQRAELEQVTEKIAASSVPAPDREAALSEAEAAKLRLEKLEGQLLDVKKLQRAGAEGVIDTLESIRDRMGKIETRVAEMSREARAKSGRLDALSRHVAGVETRLTTALGRGGKPVVAVASDVDKQFHATG